MAGSRTSDILNRINDKEEESKFEQSAIQFIYDQAKSLLSLSGRDQDNKLAVIFFRKAAELGHTKAQYMLSWCLKNGVGGPRNMHESVHWCQKAALKGELFAQYDLACYLSSGDEQAQQKAYQCFKIIGATTYDERPYPEQQAILDAKYRVGQFQLNHNNDTLAYQNFYIAARQGHEPSRTILKDARMKKIAEQFAVKSELPPAQSAEKPEEKFSAPRVGGP